MPIASTGISKPNEVRSRKQNLRNLGSISNETTTGGPSANSPPNVIDVDSSDEIDVNRFQQIQQSSTSPAISSVNPQDLVKCESEFCDESVDTDMNYDDGPEEILGGNPFDSFGETTNYSSYRRSATYAGMYA